MEDAAKDNEGDFYVKHDDRREMPRYRTRERALLAVGPEKEHVFHLLDISLGGAGFRYMGKKSRTADLRRVDLYFGDDLLLSGVRVELIEDTQMLRGLIPFRRCGLCFTKLTEEQTEQLEHYVEQVAAIEV